MAEKTASFDKQRTIPAIQTGMDRYIQIKCKRSPLNTVGNKVKINKSNVHARSTNIMHLSRGREQPSKAGAIDVKENKAPIYLY